jgi:aminopeptidase N
MVRSAAVLLALLVSIALPARAQSNAERMANDRYTRSHDYDLIHQSIALKRFDWDSTAFDGQVVTTLAALRPGLDSVVLDAGHLLDVRSVTGTGGRLAFSRHGDTLAVRLARPAAFHDTVRFTITYRGNIENGRGLTFKKAEAGREHYPQQIWSQGEADDNHRWFPTFDFPDDKMTWDLTATVPAMYTVVSNGALVQDTRSAGQRTMKWSQTRPSASYLVSIVIAPLAHLRDTWRRTPVDYYVYHEDSALARPLFRVTPDMIDTYSRLTGVAYPWAKYAQTTVADFFGGMENVSATTLVDWLPDARAYQDRPWYQYILIPHELAHQWFGDYVTTENWANMWLNEGFAEFMPGQYWGAKLGRQAEDDYYVDEYNQFMGIDARRRMPVAALGSNNIYPRGALILEMLKKHLGEKPFWAGISRYLNRHAYDNATTDDLRQAILDATGQNLDWFWDQWVYQAGYPEFTVTQAYDAAAHRLTLNVRQTQADTATADSTGLRFTTPAIFRMPVTIRVGTPAGDVTAHADLNQREQAVVVDGVSAPPTMVVFDDGNTILKKLTFDQPTAQLATQLARDPDLWNRTWVIQQLAARPTDSAAVAALAGAAAHADYSQTRSEAATALARFPAGAALPALAAAYRDTSARVRRAAIVSVGRLRDGGGDAIALARQAWDRDGSYEVRAAALGALARLDSATRTASIRAGLAAESYRSSIRNAAFGALIQFPDALPAAELEPFIGREQFASFALAAMAAKGDQTAATALMGHLNDARGWVRGWTLDAIRNALPPEAAVAQLKSAQSGLSHADTRKAVAAAIEQLEKQPAR